MNLTKLARELKPYVQRWVDGVANALNLDDLADVNAPAPTDGDALMSVGGVWVNRVMDPTIYTGDLIYRYGTDNTNLAAYSLGARAYASSGSGADNAIDGDDATYWQAGTGGLGPSDNGQRFMVDLQTAQLVSRYVFDQGNDIDYRIAVYKIQVSDDTVNWTDVTGEISSTDQLQQGTFTPVSKRYIGVYCVTDYYQWIPWRIYRFEIYGSASTNYLARLAKTSHIGWAVGTQTDGSLGYIGSMAPAAHNQAASTIDVTDAGGYYTGDNAETVLQEVGADNAASIHDNVSGEIDALTALTLPVMGDVLLVESSAASMAKRELSLASLALLRDDYPLKDAVNGMHFTEYASGVPTGWAAVTAATASNQALEYSFWRIDGSGNSTYKYKRQMGVTLESLAANQFRTWQWTGVYVRDGMWVQNLLYSFGIYADNAGAPNEDVYVKTFLQWYAPGQVWRTWGEIKDGATVTTGSAYLLPTPLVQPLTIRQLVRNTTYAARAYISTAPFDMTHTLLLSATASATWGNVWMQIEQVRNTQGVNDSLYINAVDTYEAAG